MSISSPLTWGTWQTPPFPVHRFSVDDYHRMIQAGVLTEQNAVELLEGWIVPKMARGPAHDATIELVQEAIQPRLPAGWKIRVQSAITTDDSEPEPDLAVVQRTARAHRDRHPSPRETGIVVEVADSSIDYDRDVKCPLYARANIPLYWILNLVDSQLEVYADPTGPNAAPTYRVRQVFGAADTVAFVLAGQTLGTIAVRDLLP